MIKRKHVVSAVCVALHGCSSHRKEFAMMKKFEKTEEEERR
jgi:hypothetical protein